MVQGRCAFVGLGLILSSGFARPHPFPESILVPDGRHTVVVRQQLSAGEVSAPCRISISLRMRNYPEFLARVQSGQRIAHPEMEAKYLPARSDYEDVCAWLVSQGFQLTLKDRNHTQVFARGTVAQAAAAFGVTFARVADDGEEFTSAISIPSLPERLGGVVLSINGLQPHLRARPEERAPLFPQGGSPLDSVAQLAQAMYQIPPNLTGAGQTVATVGIQSVADSDLALYWSTNNIPHTTGIARIAVDGGGTGSGKEDTEDVEAISSLAPAANIRLYESPDAFTCFAQVLNDQASDPSITVLNSSYAFNYQILGPAESQSQTFAQLAAAGVTVLNASGDLGSNGGLAYPASDPNVLGVGATMVDYYGNETAWASPIVAPGGYASGGGLSPLFARPSWQSVSPWGVAGAITQRMGPDVAALTGGTFIYNGTANSLGGTSEAAPVFAGVVALLNQARATAGLPPLGLLGPKLYPLLGTGAFNEIDDGGSNGAYMAGPGYNLVTGLGSPNVPKLVAALLSDVGFTAGPSGIHVHNAGDSVTFQASASGNGTIAYQWQWQVAGASFWTDLTDGNGISGSATPSLTLAAGPAFNGGSFHCVARNASSTDTSTTASLIVENPVDLSTFGGVPGEDSPLTGPLSQARFGSLQGIAVDPADNVYVTDFGFSIISEIAAGEVSTLAGTPGAVGSANGTGPFASFLNPWGLAVDAAGNVFVADSGNDMIRKITPNGVVTTLAGAPGVAGSADGIGSAATFNSPYGVAVDSVDNVYVADTENLTIRKITPEGVVTTFAGTAGAPGGADGTGSAARFYYPYGVAVDVTGNVYVADTLANRICRISPEAVVTTIAGTSGFPGNGDGVGTEAQFNNPSALAVDDSGNVFVADSGNNLVRQITPTGVVTTIAGPGAGFNNPLGIAVDTDDRLYIADSNNFTIRIAQAGPTQPIITAQPQSQTADVGAAATFTVAASGPSPLGYQWYFEPAGGTAFAPIAAATGSSYTVASTQVANAGSYAVIVTNGGGAVGCEPAALTVAAVPTFTAQPASQNIAPGSSATFSAAVTGTTAVTYQWYFNGAPIGGATGASYTIHSATPADAGTYSVVASDAGGSLSSSGAVLAVQNQFAAVPGFSITTLAGLAGVEGSLDGAGGGASFLQPGGVAADAAGNVFVADTSNSAIRRVSTEGIVTTLAGTAGVEGSADGTGSAAQFNHPYGIAVDSADNVYVSDTFNGTLRKISPAGAVVTLAGTAGVNGFADGAGGAASFNLPAGIAVDGSGNVYVADSGNNTIRVVTPQGVVSTLAGAPNTSGYLDGAGSAARFTTPYGVAVDGAGNVYVADTGNSVIRRIAPGGVVTGFAGARQDPGSADGTGVAAGFFTPIDVAVDSQGNVFVADSTNCTVREITPAGAVTTVAGSAGVVGNADGIGSTAEFAYPTGIATGAQGAIYVADAGNGTIRMGMPNSTPAPIILEQPASQVVASGALADLTVSAGGTAPLTYQWSFNGVAISGATSATYAIDGATAANTGSYTVTVTNALGTVTSHGAVLAVGSAGAPVIAIQPLGQTVTAGSTAVLTAPVTTGPAVSYQWFLNGIPVAEATGAVLELAEVNSANAGSYLCLVTNASGANLSDAAVLTVTTTDNPGRLINLSVLASIQKTMTVGFVNGGSGTSGQESLLIRATGPALTAFGLTGVMADPTLTLVQQSTGNKVAYDAGWGSDAAEVTAADAATGAFALTNAASLDSALVVTLSPSTGGYTAAVTGASGDSGMALAEIYDASGSAYTMATPRLVNISGLNLVPAGGNLTAGFVIGGSTSETVLIRATGPALTAFGVTSVLPDPQITVFPQGSASPVGANAGWGGSALIATADSAVGAFPLNNPSSKDSAVLLTLPPGLYSAQVSSVSGASGTALVEVYEVP